MSDPKQPRRLHAACTGQGRTRCRRARGLAAVACALTIAACGSAQRSDSARSSGYSQGVRYSDCMRSHGVPNFPDPSPGGGIPFISANSGINTNSPAFQGAQSTCRTLAPGGQGVTAAMRTATDARWLTISRCMRRHGVPDFPDPTLSMPPSNSNAYGFISDQNGVVVALPGTNPTSPAFLHAATACKMGLPKSG